MYLNTYTFEIEPNRLSSTIGGNRKKDQSYATSQVTKELSLCHKLCFSNPYIFETQCRRL